MQVTCQKGAPPLGNPAINSVKLIHLKYMWRAIKQAGGICQGLRILIGDSAKQFLITPVVIDQFYCALKYILAKIIFRVELRQYGDTLVTML